MSNELTKSFEEMTYLEVFEAAVDKNTCALEEKFIEEVENSNNKEAQWIYNLEINNDYEEEFPDDELSLLTNTYYEYYSGKSRSIVLAKFIASVRYNREIMTLDQSNNPEEFHFEDYYYSFNEMILFGFKRDLLESKFGRPLNQLEITAIGKALNNQFSIQPFEKNGEITEDVWNNLFFWKRMYYNSANELILTKEYEYSFNDYMIDWDIDLTVPENALKFCVAYINANLEQNYSPGYEAEKTPKLFRLDDNWTEGDCSEILISFISQKNITCKYELDYTFENGIKKLTGKAKEQFEQLYGTKSNISTLNKNLIETTIEKSEEQIIVAEISKSIPKVPTTRWNGTQGELLAQLISLHNSGLLEGSYSDLRRTVSMLIPGTDWLLTDSVRTIRKRLRETKRDTPIDIYDKVEAKKREGYQEFLKETDEDLIKTKPSKYKK